MGRQLLDLPYSRTSPVRVMGITRNSAVAFGAIVLCALVSSSPDDVVLELPVPETDFLEEAPADKPTPATTSTEERKVSGTSAAEKFETPVKGETTMRSRIKKALTVAEDSLSAAHGKKQKAAAKAAVKAALADADNAGTIAWANRNLDLAKAWAVKALKHDAKALGAVAAWEHGQKAEGIKYRTKTERAVQAMIAVAAATKNKEMEARENKLREEGKLKRYDEAITNARKSVSYAAKSVEKARAALALTMGTKARIMAKHALVRAQESVDEGNRILQAEMKKKNAITENRLQSDGARLVGENELHYRARKTFYRANRVLKMVTTALEMARKNSFAHKEAATKRDQKITMEKASKLQAKEKNIKSEEARKRLGIKTREEYAAYLAKEALKFGEVARDDAKKAAAAGKLAAEKAKASAHIKAQLGIKSATSTAPVTEALERENIAADLATKAASMESAIVTGSKIPKIVQELLESGNTKQSMLETARARAAKIHVNLEDDEDFHEFVTHRKMWMSKYKTEFDNKIQQLKADKTPGH